MLDIFVELSGLTSEVREHRLVMLRIAEALERVSPPLQATAGDTEGASRTDSRTASAPDVESGQEHYLAESPEEYMARTEHDSDLAMSLGVAPWSPDFQKSIMEVRAELMRPRTYQDEEGNWHNREPLTEEEADEAVREGFRLAKAEAHVRSGAGSGARA